MKTKRTNEKRDAILTELDAIKRLLMLGLHKAGSTQSEIAKALGVTQGTVSKMFPRDRSRVPRRT